MKRPTFLKLGHLYRGSWMAEAKDARSRAVIGDGPIPVLRDWETGNFNWKDPAGPTLTEERGETQQGGIDWWTHPQHEPWRNALTDGAIVWVRQAKGAGDDSGSVGRSKGVWRIGDTDIGETRLFLRLKERIGDVKA